MCKSLAILAVLALNVASCPPGFSDDPTFCKVQLRIETEDNAVVDDSQCACLVESYRDPSKVNGETVYGAGYRIPFKPKQGVLSASLQPGVMIVSVTLPGYAPVFLGFKEAKAKETLDLGTVKLNKGFVWKLKVQNDVGRAVPQVEVYARYRYGDITMKAVGNDEGVVEFPLSTEEKCALAVFAPGHQSQSVYNIPVQSASTTSITMNRAHPSSGILHDAEGKPVVGARLVMFAGIQNVTLEPREVAKTDAKGKFVLDQLIDFAPQMVMTEYDGKIRAVKDVQSGTTDNEWKLSPLVHLSGGAIGRKPYDPPTLKYSQTIKTRRTSSGQFNKGEVKLDDQGKFRIENLIPGSVRLELGYRAVELEIARDTDDRFVNFDKPWNSYDKPPAPARAELIRQEPTLVALPLSKRKRVKVRATVVAEDGHREASA